MKVYRPTSLREALRILRDEPQALPIAGGTDVMVVCKRGLEPETMLDLWGLSELQGIEEDGDKIRIGPLTTHGELANSPLLGEYAPMLTQAAAAVGSAQIRNRGTVGGNIGNCSPAADTVGPLIALDAQLVLQSAAGERTIPVEEYATGPGRNVREPGELITRIIIDRLGASESGGFAKMGQREALACAKLSVTVRVGIQQDRFTMARVVLAAVGPTIFRAKKAEDALLEQLARRESIERAVPLVREAATPISDIRSEDWYREEMTGVLFQRLMAGLVA